MIIALFAVDEKGGMGLNGDMPWPFNKEDMIWFKEATQGHVVVMGKKSWNSPDMPKPLPKRTNVVFTNEFMDNEHIIQIQGDVCEGLLSIEKKFPELDIFVIGGANLLKQSIPILDKAYITRIPGIYETDVKINLEEFLTPFKLANTKEYQTCKVETYEAISRRT